MELVIIIGIVNLVAVIACFFITMVRFDEVLLQMRRRTTRATDPSIQDAIQQIMADFREEMYASDEMFDTLERILHERLGGSRSTQNERKISMAKQYVLNSDKEEFELVDVYEGVMAKFDRQDKQAAQLKRALDGATCSCPNFVEDVSDGMCKQCGLPPRK